MLPLTRSLLDSAAQLDPVPGATVITRTENSFLPVSHLQTANVDTLS